MSKLTSRDLITPGATGQQTSEYVFTSLKPMIGNYTDASSLAKEAFDGTRETMATRSRRAVARGPYVGSPSSEEDEEFSDIEEDVSRLSPASRRRVKR